MNLLLNNAPDYVKVDGRKEFLNTDFRTSIRFELLMNDSTKSDEEKLSQAMHLYYGQRSFPGKNIEEAVNKLLWFYTCGKEPEKQDKKETGKKNTVSKVRVYDYEHDADYIYSAFLQQYNVDLQTEKIHWWKFKAMFRALTDQCEFVKIMGYRSIEINNNMTKSQKEFYQKMKKLHALPLPKSEVQKIKAIEDALLNGGDLSAVIGMINGQR